MRTRNRRSRIITGIALLAASAAVSTAMLGLGGMSAEVRQSPAVVSAVPLMLAEHALPPIIPLARQPLPVIRFTVAAGARLLPHITADAAVSQAPLASGLLGGLTAGSVLGWWLLAFARRNSRTRGQPRVGVLIH